MSGYYGYSMSNNAVAAYAGGEKPLSKWTKQAILEAIEEIDSVKATIYSKLKKFQLEKLLSYSSYHHTSSYYNTTDFYVLDIDKLEKYSFEQLKSIEKKKVEKEKEEKYSAEVQIWGGTRKHPKMLGTKIVSGIKKGDWLVDNNGNRYKLTANKTLKYWKMEEE